MVRPIAIELFCGCGGLSTGLLDAGIKVAAGFDNDRTSVEAYNYNHAHRGSIGIRQDLSAISGSELLAKANLRVVDLLVGGPPCQAFSIIGKRRGLEDERASLILEFLRFVEELNPTAVLLENVPTLATAEGGGILSEILSTLGKLDYGTRAETVLSVSFGVPQMRKRLFVLAIRGKRGIEFPNPTHGDPSVDPALRPVRSVKSALADLPNAAEFGECGIYNHEPTQHSDGMLARFALLPPGDEGARIIS